MNFAGGYGPLVAFLLAWLAKATVLLAVAFVAALLLRQQSAALRHRLWAIAILGSLALPVVAVAIPAWHILSAPPALVQNTPQTVVVTNVAGPPPLPAPSARPLDFEMLVGAALLVWALGTMFIAFRLAAGLARLWRVSAYSKRAPEGVCGDLGELCSNFDIRRKVRLLESANAAMMPMTWGIVRPTIVLPAAAGEWGTERRRIVLSHELAHVMRSDWLLQICAEALRACFWFHPLAWIAAKRLRQESEHACDDTVLNSGIAAPEYASQLLALAQSLKTPDWRFSLALAIARPSNLERRFAAMLDCSISRNPLSRRNSLAGILLAAGLLLPLAALSLSAKPLPPIQPEPVRSSVAAVSSSHSSPQTQIARAALVSAPNAADEWPAGRGRAAFLATCSSCHAPGDVRGQNLDSRGWADVINRMIQLGAHGSDQDFAAILDYLTRNFGPKSARPAPTNLDATPHPAAEPTQVITNASDRKQAQTVASGPLGSISGSVGDPSGALVPGADIMLTDIVTGEFRKIPAGSGGDFTFANLIPDNYELAISQPGFQVYKQTIQLSQSENLELPELLLRLGNIASEVTIQASRGESASSQAPPSAMVPVLACPAALQAAQPAYTNPVQPGPPPRRVRVGGSVEMARLVQQTMPIYPAVARAAGMQGTVVMNTIIGKDGTPLSLCVVSGPALLAQAALDAVNQWRYSPTLLDGQPVEVPTEITAVFTLKD